MEDSEDSRAKPFYRSAFVSSRPTDGEEMGFLTAGERKRDEEDEDPLLFLSKPAGWAVSAIATHAELISAAVLSLSAPFLSIFFQSRAVPSRFAHSAASALRRLAFAIVATAYAVACLIFIMAFAFLLGVFLVRMWLEEPVLLSRTLHFDYTQLQPGAVAMLGRVGASGRAVPAGHIVSVSLRLVMPESGYNRHVGIFQVSAEAILSNGHTIATSSQPCMLKFMSLPVRLMRAFAMAFPLLIGAHTEAQHILFEVLRYNEGILKTEAIKVRLAPRAGTFDLPQIYDAEILLHTRLPRRKEVVYNWKWTFYLWASLNMYVLLLILLFCCFRPFDVWRHWRDGSIQHSETVSEQFRAAASIGELNSSEEFVDALERWRERSTRRSKRVAPIEATHTSKESDEGSASNVVVGEAGELIEDSGDFAAS